MNEQKGRTLTWFFKTGIVKAKGKSGNGFMEDKMKRGCFAFLCLLAGVASFYLSGCAAQTEKGSALMNQDEQAIRRWFDRWMKATQKGDLGLAKSLIADEAVFLIPSADRMDKESFAAAATATDPNTDFRLDCSIQEITVLGDHAWLWTKLSLTMTDKRSRTSSRMAGHSLSILKRQGDGWVVLRDANTMVPVKQD